MDLWANVRFRLQGSTDSASEEIRQRVLDVIAGTPVKELQRLGPEILGRFLRLYGEVMPEATEAGRRLHRSGALREMGHERAPVSEVLTRVGEEITSAT